MTLYCAQKQTNIHSRDMCGNPSLGSGSYCDKTLHNTNQECVLRGKAQQCPRPRGPLQAGVWGEGGEGWGMREEGEGWGGSGEE